MSARGGRPRAADAEALGRMAILLVSGQVTAVREAARRAVHLAEQGSNRDAIIERLRRSYRRHHGALEQWAESQLVADISPFLLKSTGALGAMAKQRREREVKELLEGDRLNEEEVRSLTRLLGR